MDILGIVEKGDDRKTRARKYIPIVFTEEGVYRIILLGFVFSYLTPWISVPLSALIFGVSHFFLFRWPMVVCATVLGLFNGFVYYGAVAQGYPQAGFIGCLILHLVVGMGGWELGLMKEWRK